MPYLENTARYRIFEELWAVRTLLVHPDEPDVGSESGRSPPPAASREDEVAR